MSGQSESLQTKPLSPPAQLQMVWPQERLADRSGWTVPTGYVLRTFRPGDQAGVIEVMSRAGFPRWSEEEFEAHRQALLEQGHFVVVAQAGQIIVATAMALARPVAGHLQRGELGWVAGDPAHAGKGLGRVVCAAATKRLLDEGFRDIYLLTDDFRLAAITVYLQLGYRPLLFQPDMAGRWRAIFAQLNRPFVDYST